MNKHFYSYKEMKITDKTIKTDTYSLIYFEGIAEVLLHKKIMCMPNSFLIVHGKQKGHVHFLGDAAGWKIDFSESLCSNIFLSQIMDCPIFIDFFNLDNETKECLLVEPIHYSDFLNALQLLKFLVQTNDIHSHKLVRNAFIIFLTITHKYHFEHMSISSSTMMPHYQIGDFLRFMSDNYATVTLSSIAENFNYHPNYFSKLFRELSSENFSQKLRQIRLEQANHLLLTTNMSIEDIRLAVGFHEKSYFHKIFRDKYKMTPSKYRKYIQTLKKEQIKTDNS